MKFRKFERRHIFNVKDHRSSVRNQHTKTKQNKKKQPQQEKDKQTTTTITTTKLQTKNKIEDKKRSGGWPERDSNL